jgi:hypothetical protein
MNKTIIALAIAAALPVAAQADVTISGTLNTKYKNTGSIDTDSMLRVDSAETLSNGMVATAGFAITADTDDDTENSGTASLTGNFGVLTVGSIDADGAFQAGDVGGAVSNTTESTDSTSSSVYGIHYSNDMGALNIAAQVNANTGPTGGGAAQTKSTQMSATYALNDDLTIGYSYASALADDASNSNHDGIHEGQTAVGASYSMGSLDVSVGKVNLKDSAVSPDALVSATYTLDAGGLSIVAQADNAPSGDYQLNLSYALTDAFTVSSEVDKGKTTTMVATFVDGDLTATVAKQDDGTTDASISLDYGNADLTIGRVGARAGSAGVNRADAAEYSHVSYSVAF